MIRLVSRGQFKPESVEKFKKLAKILVAASVQEEGCIHYELCQEMDEPNILAFIEDWKDQAAIDLHNNTAHFTTIVPQFEALLSAPMDCNKYEIVN